MEKQLCSSPGCSCCQAREDREKVNTIHSAASKEDVNGCCFGTHFLDSTLPLNAFSGVRAQDINVLKEKHSEKSSPQHEL